MMKTYWIGEWGLVWSAWLLVWVLLPNQAQPLVPGQLMVANEQMQLVPYAPAAQPHVQYLGCKSAAGST